MHSSSEDTSGDANMNIILNSILPVKRWYAARREQSHRTRASESHGAGARSPARPDRYRGAVAGRADPAAGDGRPARLQPRAAARSAERSSGPGPVAAPAAPRLLRRQTRAERAGADSPHHPPPRGRAPGLDGMAGPGGPERAEEAQSGDAQARRRGGVDTAHAQEPRFPLQDLLSLAPPRHPRRGAPLVGPRRALYRSTDVLARGASADRRRARRDPPHAGEAGSQAPRLGDGEAPGVDLHGPAARALALLARAGALEGPGRFQRDQHAQREAADLLALRGRELPHRRIDGRSLRQGFDHFVGDAEAFLRQANEKPAEMSGILHALHHAKRGQPIHLLGHGPRSHEQCLEKVRWSFDIRGTAAPQRKQNAHVGSADAVVPLAEAVEVPPGPSPATHQREGQPEAREIQVTSFALPLHGNELDEALSGKAAARGCSFFRFRSTRLPGALCHL